MKDSGKLQEINEYYFNPDFTLDYDGIAEDVGEANEATGTGLVQKLLYPPGQMDYQIWRMQHVIAVENAYIPFNYIDLADGKAKVGLRCFNELSNLLNFVPVYTPASWDGMLVAVADGHSILLAMV